MTPQELREWRLARRMKKIRLAEALGVSTRTLDYYESGCYDDGRPVTIPRYIALACAAIAFGLPPLGGQAPVTSDH